MKNVLTMLKGLVPTIMIALTLLQLYKPNLALKVQAIANLIQEIIADIEDAIGTSKFEIFRGLSGVNKYGNQVITRLRQILAEETMTTRLVSEAEALTITLDDSSIVEQPRSGKDKKALDDFKIQAREIVTKIRNRK